MIVNLMGSESECSEVILGVDGGATSTVCVCMPLLPFSDHHHFPDPLPILGRAIAGCSNYNSVGEDKARCTLKKIIEETISKSGVKGSAVQAVCLGVSGVNHPKDQERVLNWIRDIFPAHVKIYVHNDAVAALASGTMGKLHGCVLIAGTGSISYGITEGGREARAAGAGPVLGDWGRCIRTPFWTGARSPDCYILAMEERWRISNRRTSYWIWQRKKVVEPLRFTPSTNQLPCAPV